MAIIKLKRVRDKAIVDFNMDHALALLRRNSKDWVISDDTKHEFKANEIIRRPSKGVAKKPKSANADRKG